MSKSFELGQMVATCGVNNKMQEDAEFAAFVRHSLSRYITCDWGEIDDDDKEMNDAALGPEPERILAAYKNDKYKIWIITEFDRSATTILFPSEY